MSMSIPISSSTFVSRRPLHLSSTLQALSWNPVSKFGFSKRKDQLTLHGNKNRSLVVYANVIPGPLPSLPPPSGGSSTSWILAVVVSVILPFFSHKWGPLWVLKNRIDNTVQMVEDIVETVEKVAGEVDKIAEDIGHDLPAGKLKDMMKLVEHVAEETAKTADALDTIIDQAQEAEDRVECIVESVVTSKKDQSIVESVVTSEKDQLIVESVVTSEKDQLIVESVVKKDQQKDHED